MNLKDIKDELSLSQEAEDAVIAALIHGKDNVYYQHADKLHADLFRTEHAKKVFLAIKEIISNGDIISEFKVRATLKNGSVSYINALPKIYSKQEFDVHVDYLNENFKKTIANDFLMEAIRSINEDEKVDAVLSSLITNINSMSRGKSKLIKIDEAVMQVMEGINARLSNNNAVTGIPSGLTAFDDFSNGFQGGDLVVVAGETSQGKTALAVSMAANQGVLYQKPVLIVSLEMTSNQIAGRLLSQETGVSSKTLLSGLPTQSMLQSLNNNMSRLVNAPIYIDNNNASDINEIVSMIYSAVARYGISIAYIDYLQLITAKTSRGTTKEQEIADNCRLLKNTAIKLNIPIVLLSQLSRDRANPKPSLARLRGSGQIEEAADIVWFVWRPEYYGMNEIEMNNGTLHPSEDAGHSIIAKGRNIGITDFVLTWEREKTKYSDYVNQHSVMAHIQPSSVFQSAGGIDDVPF